MTSPPQLDVAFDAFPALALAAARARAEIDPGPPRAAFALGVAGLGGLQSAAVLAELGSLLDARLAALSLRWDALDRAYAAAAAGYGGVETVLVRALRVRP